MVQKRQNHPNDKIKIWFNCFFIHLLYINLKDIHSPIATLQTLYFQFRNYPYQLCDIKMFVLKNQMLK